MEKRTRPRYFINSLARGLSILNSFSSTRPTLSPTELATANKITLATCARYISTLRDLGYLVQNPVTKKYTLTPRILSLGFPFLKNMDLRARLLPYMIEVTKELDVTTQCAVLDGTDIVFLDRVRSSQVVNLDLTVGSRLPCYCTALGKAMLAFMDDVDARKIIDSIEFVQHTPYTVTDRDTFERSLRLTKRRGYAINDQELTLGLKTLATPIFKDSRVEGAFGMSYPIHRIEKNDLENVFVERLKDIEKRASI
jgi:IclR family pca regulon transcriptional regulator